MIEELKVLLETLASVPSLAMWVAVGYLFYRVFIWGSVVLAIATAWRLCVQAFQYWVAESSQLTRETEQERTKQAEIDLEKTRVEKTPVEKQLKVDDITITGNEAELRLQLRRLAGKGVSIDSRYIHDEGIRWLAEAIDAKESSESE